ncbi:hypothetical protein [Bacillus sp. EB106-08-02-XG196]|uniref:hypothetical protein n=1 Tax=Bacillus sp. EB106-08-02-XG196 TaxID=2737049 RepID=UPI001C4E85B2|nr:hypothetical protein [Bacillus sp. EB106-08-02-XG196]
MLRFSSLCEVDIVINVTDLVTFFHNHLQMERTLSQYTIGQSHNALCKFILFMGEQVGFNGIN